MRLEGKKALITGATGGIGSAIAKKLHAEGATVVLSGTRETVLQQLATELQNRVYVLPTNLEDPESVAILFDKAEELAGEIEILVCNAGVTMDNLAMRMKNEEWNRVLNINLTSTFILNRAAIKRMAKRRYGRIINISSVIATTGNFGQANYAASKAGMIGMSKSIALEVGTRGITVNCIAPGFIETPMTDVLKDEIKEGIKAKIALGRLGVPEDVANAALFLASEESSYMTGNTLHVNGGLFMPS